MNRSNFLKTLGLGSLSALFMKLQDFPQLIDNQTTEKMPALFVGHGSPMNALEDNTFTQSLRKLGATFQQTGKRPTAILVVSAHWLTQGSFVQMSQQPKTIHDFGGFPQALFEVEYPAPGAPKTAKETALLSHLLHETNDWGLDHGAWTILVHLFPAADIPVFQMSIDYHQPLQYHLDLAAQLRSLREKGVLVIGSGNIVHNLRMSIPKLQQGDTSPYDWATEFDQWVEKQIQAGNYAALAQYEQMGAAGKLSVPTPDHYIPMLYTLGLADGKESIHTVYESVEYGGLSMRTFQVGA